MDIAYPIAWFVFFIISTTFHEAAHALAAKMGGDPTAYAGGQLSLNPLPHIRREPLGMVIFPLVSSFLIGWPFGWASAPYDVDWAFHHPRKAAWMALAGPAANLLLVVLCIATVKIGILAGIFSEPNSVNFRHIVDPASTTALTGLSTVVSMIFTLNLVLVVLNLFPLPPLDGSGILPLFLNDNNARTYQQVISNPMLSLFGFILAWQAFNPLFKVVFVGAMNVIYWGAGFH